ncbi:MAG: rRNA maturation RNase YbeY [Cyclobacteriaceae bacterium]
MATSIQFFSEETTYHLRDSYRYRLWLKHTAQLEGCSIENINIVFCPDSYLYQINFDYLGHDTFTDIVTFDQSENSQILEGDIFISVERAKENAQTYAVPLEMELSRLMVHGVLHLIGYSDKTKDEKKEMRKKEEAYLSLLKSDFV